ncbi:hypothetical protein [Chromobacterium haemolyticum]|uniref:Uncharacterized protein n=1 Tax=Chromobacterium haemolyticum TaxID=394935 RepID=A0A1W0D5X0_9NEIS|nr:hypothetical protein [Chromobacterium haemolyticum]OQS42348.1 hypothetical protein B0T45_06050 [Chromobacterium haemolyticum]
MDRQIVYPGAIPLETDILNTNKNMMVALSKLAAAVLGIGTIANGFAVTQTAPASLQINVAPGEIYALANIDATAFSSLAADTTHSILKQGIALDAQLLTLTAPATIGYSVNYLIQASYQDQDANAVALPYYNSSNPSQPWSGPNNSGQAQYTTRKGVAVVQAKAGIATTTGSQQTPAPDSGYIGLYVVTVAYGQTTITSGNISQYSGAPIVNSTLLGQSPAFQNPVIVPNATQSQHAMPFGQAQGQFAPIANPVLTGGAKVHIAANNNLEVLAPNTGPGSRIFARNDSGVPTRLELQAAQVILSTNSGTDGLVYDSTTGNLSVAGTASVSNATSNSHAVNLGQMNSSLAGKANTATTLAGYGITDGVGVNSPTLQTSAKVHISTDRNLEIIAPNTGAGGRIIARDDHLALTRLELQGASVIFPLSSGADGLVFTASTGDVALPGITSLLGTLGAIFGITQSTADFTSSRALGTTYYNTTPRPILIECCIFLGAGGTQRLYKNGLNTQTFTNNTGSASYMTFDTMILPGQSYAITASGSPSYTWYETR